MRISLPIPSDDEVAAQIREQKSGLAASTINRAVAKELSARRERSAALQAEYDGKSVGSFIKRSEVVTDSLGKPTGLAATYTVPKG